MKIYIKKPIWNTQSIGISKKNLKDNITEVEILYTDTAGNRVYPGVYLMKTDQIKKYPIRDYPGTPPLHVVPIDEFEIETLTERQKEYKEYCRTYGIPFDKSRAS